MIATRWWNPGRKPALVEQPYQGAVEKCFFEKGHYVDLGRAGSSCQTYRRPSVVLTLVRLGRVNYVFLEKAFLYGALLWLLDKTGCAPGCPPFSSDHAICRQLGGTYLPGRSAEITDALHGLG